MRELKTIADCDVAQTETGVAYRTKLEKIKAELLAPIQAEIKRQNAVARKQYAALSKRIEAYRAILEAEAAVQTEETDQ